MLAALEGMIAELRQIGVPVSLAERIDAMQSLRHLPVGDRPTVKAALRAVLVKTHDHELAFDAVFDLYFTAQPGQAGSAQENSQAAPGQDGQEAQGGQGGLSGQNGHGGGGLGALDAATLTELLLTALREGNEVMMRALAGMFVDRHAGIEPGRPVAGTYYVFRTLRAIELEALQEKILATREQELTRLKAELDRLEAELVKRTVEYVSTENLYRLTALVRGEIRKVCQAPPPVEEAMAAEE